jgi:hypothetical protein
VEGGGAGGGGRCRGGKIRGRGLGVRDIDGGEIEGVTHGHAPRKRDRRGDTWACVSPMCVPHLCVCVCLQCVCVSRMCVSNVCDPSRHSSIVAVFYYNPNLALRSSGIFFSGETRVSGFRPQRTPFCFVP